MAPSTDYNSNKLPNIALPHESGSSAHPIPPGYQKDGYNGTFSLRPSFSVCIFWPLHHKYPKWDPRCECRCRGR